jgi:hypothetical protein
MVEVYYNRQRIALHRRNTATGSYNTNKDHLSSAHKAYSDWSPEYFKSKASRHGENVLAVVNNVLEECDYPETAYKRAMGIIQLHKAYGSSRLDDACQRALHAGTSSYKRISNILKNNLDKEPINNEEENTSHIPEHDNIRGPGAYN